MKQKKTCISLLFVLFIGYACKKSNSTPPGEVSATVNNSNYQDTNPKAWLYPGWMFSISSIAKNDSSNLTLQFPSSFVVGTPITTGTLDYNPTNGVGGIYAAPDSSYFRFGQPTGYASITVTSWDSVKHRIAGTFSSVIYKYRDSSGIINDSIYNYISNDSTVLNNGAFNLSYTIIPN